jgi:phospholipase/lecithinase/hemolysin
MPFTSDTTVISACDSYTWTLNGQTYSNSGTYTSVSGYNTSVLVLTITSSTSNATAVAACDSYTWSVNGQTYTASGSYTDVKIIVMQKF